MHDITKLQYSQSLIGGEIFSLVTAGMYDSPLRIYREYIQNSADAISLNRPQMGRVDVQIDRMNESITIRDNGPGLSPAEAVQNLIPVAKSSKQRGVDRGFRGIGRLAGLAFAERVSFTTRASPEQSVCRITWNGFQFGKLISKKKSYDSALKSCVVIEEIDNLNYPDHFFEVYIDKIGRHVAGTLLNRDLVQSYISEVCPVPMSPNFPFSPEIAELLANLENWIELDIFINEDAAPLVRKFDQKIQLSESRVSQYVGLETVSIPSLDGGISAIGWLAHSDYFGAIPKCLGIRGIRARIGNLQIGDESIFSHLFSEERFNRWCVGEVHILDSRIVPNGCRDYFELNPHVRNIENYLTTRFRQLASRCRKESSTRYKAKRLTSEVDKHIAIYEFIDSGVLSERDTREIVEGELKKIDDIKSTFGNSDKAASVELEAINRIEKRLMDFQFSTRHRMFDGVPKSKISVYQKVFYELLKVTRDPDTVLQIIESMLDDVNSSKKVRDNTENTQELSELEISKGTREASSERRVLAS